MKRKSVCNPYPPDVVSHHYFQRPPEHGSLTWSSIFRNVCCLQDFLTEQDQIYRAPYLMIITDLFLEPNMVISVMCGSSGLK